LPARAQAIEHGLAEEAFEIYKKFDKKVEAIGVLLEHVPEGGLKRAFDYATKVSLLTPPPHVRGSMLCLRGAPSARLTTPPRWAS